MSLFRESEWRGIFFKFFFSSLYFQLFYVFFCVGEVFWRLENMESGRIAVRSLKFQRLPFRLSDGGAERFSRC